MAAKNPLMKTDRLEFFSDGVFAIAITLLVLEIKIPTHEMVHHAGGLYCYLANLWPSYASYIITFFVIGVYWSNHHHLFSFIIKKTDHFFNLINVFFLMTVAFMPFSTAILGDFVMDPEYRNAAVSIYCFGMMLPIPTLMFLFFYANHKKRLVDPKLSNKFMRKQLLKLAASLIFVCIALAFSFNYPTVSICMILGSLFLYLMPPDMPEYDEGK